MLFDLDQFNSPANVFGRNHQKEGFALSGAFALLTIVSVGITCVKERRKTKTN